MMSTYYPFVLGDFTCTCLSDFARERTYRETFPRIDPIELQKEIEAGNYAIELDSPMPLQGNVLLVDNGKQKIMIDAGLPTAFGGQLLKNLDVAGVAASEIDLIIVTHADGDHIGGLSNYPNAQIVMPSLSYKLWTEELDGMIEEFIKLFQGSPSQEIALQAAARRRYQDKLLALNEEGRIRLVEFGEQIVPGISLIHAPGHRRDHAAVEIISGDEMLLHIADAFRHAMQLKRHDFYCLFDSYPEILAQSIVMLLERAVKNNAIVFGAHFEFPALIKIGQNQAGYEWIEL